MEEATQEVPEGYKGTPLSLADRWFIKWHGIGSAHQNLLFRCLGCRRILTHNSIKRGLCGCGINRVSPANPTWFELFRLYFLPWTVK